MATIVRKTRRVEVRLDRLRIIRRGLHFRVGAALLVDGSPVYLAEGDALFVDYAANLSVNEEPVT